MEDGLAGPRLGVAAEAAEARPGVVTLRPFAPFSGATESDEGGGDWSFIDCEMEEVDLQDLPSATIACHLDPRVFVDGLCRVRPSRGGANTCCGSRRCGKTTPPPGVRGEARVWWAAPPRPRSRSTCWARAVLR